jgi:integrase
MFIWRVMVTGRCWAQLLARRWREVNFEAGTLEIRRSCVRATDRHAKTHRLRRVSREPATVEVLSGHHRSYLGTIAARRRAPA